MLSDVGRRDICDLLYLSGGNVMSYKMFTDSINRLSHLALSEKEEEVNRIAKSDIAWCDKKHQKRHNTKITVGSVYQIEFGKNYTPEMSYEHRGLVIGVTQQLIRVLPIYTYHPDMNVTNDINDFNQSLYLLKADKHSFLKHDSVLKLNEVKVISTKRILFYQGSIDKNSDIFKSICYRAFRYTFPEYSFMLEQANKKIAQLEKEKNNLEHSVKK